VHQSTGGEVMNETPTGTLEQLYRCPLGTDLLFPSGRLTAFSSTTSS
jgi:hypothetical protein